MRSVLMLGTAVAVLGTAGFVGLLSMAPSDPQTASTAASQAVEAPQLDPRWYGAAPYVTPMYGNPPDLPRVMRETGQKTFQLAFVLAPKSGGCQPTWDGTTPVSADDGTAAIVDGVRAAGGDVSVSVGGYGGTNLGQTCGTPEATAAAYQQVIDAHQLRAIDFNLEEPEIQQPDAIRNELAAAQILQRNNPGLYVSVTTVASTTGTTPAGQNLLDTAKALNFVPNNYATMPFNGFPDVDSQIASLEAFHGTLMSTFGWDSATAYAHEGVSLMNGRSDAGEHYRQEDMRAVLDYGISRGFSRYTFWSLNRDRQCDQPDNGQTSGTCSSVPQQPWDFTKLTAQFATAAPPAPAPPVAGG
ncbi:glycosyl hydrolase [Saccharopolyspora gloriosae]|uniref:glycosyl hydrolase n=1 Tax=Saccharopolyspora gloriosae TaxID=455344 RepID=UPI001FB56EFA|nr:glycosyl hydrolase [Saccharopolyspora gloriosae]